MSAVREGIGGGGGASVDVGAGVGITVDVRVGVGDDGSGVKEANSVSVGAGVEVWEAVTAPVGANLRRAELEDRPANRKTTTMLRSRTMLTGYPAAGPIHQKEGVHRCS